jgi:hypothetical protein
MPLPRSEAAGFQERKMEKEKQKDPGTASDCLNATDDVYLLHTDFSGMRQ